MEDERFLTIRITSLPNRPTFVVSGQIAPRSEFIIQLAAYLFDEEGQIAWEIVQDEPKIAAAAAA